MKKGYSLLECMVALGLMAVVTLTIASLFLGGQASTVHTLEGSRGSQVAELEMSHLKGLPFAELEALITTPAAARQEKLDNCDFQVESRVSRVNPAVGQPDYDLLRLQVKVSWQENRQLTVSEKNQQLKRVGAEFELRSLVAPEARF